MDNDIKVLHESQLIDGSNDWDYKKNRSLLVADSFKRLGFDNKFYRMRDCGTYLEFRRYKSGDFKLNTANFCKQRLCPMCSWRRSLKIFSQVSIIMEELKKTDYRFIFLTLTQKNCEGRDLKEYIDNMYKAWKKLFSRKKFKLSFIGWFRALEVTHNIDPDSKSYNTFHPHFHVVLVVNKSYFNDKRIYISQEEMIQLWRKSLKVDYDPNVDIRVFDKRKNIKKSVAEVAKYTVKDTDIIIPDNLELTDYSVMILDEALANRRLVAFGGVFKTIHKAMNLDDYETGDLINTDSDNCCNDEMDYIIEKYSWHIGYKQFRRI